MDPASEQDHIYVCSPADGALRQCELVSDVVQIRLALEDVEAAAQANLTIRYQQHLSSRFAAYLSRVALPHDHVVD